MGLFSKRFEQEGAGRPMPETGPARFFALLFSQFWKLVGANVLFLLFSLPIITLPAALCALNRVCISIWRRGFCYVWECFREEFRASLLPSLPPALIFLLLLFFSYYSMSLGLTNAALPLWSMLFWVLGLMALWTGFGWGTYFFVLRAMLAQKTPLLLKNAVLLCMAAPGMALVIALICIASLGAAALLFPLSLALLAFCMPALCQFAVCSLVYEQAEMYIEEA